MTAGFNWVLLADDRCYWWCWCWLVAAYSLRSFTCHQIRTNHFLTWYPLPSFLFLYLHYLNFFLIFQILRTSLLLKTDLLPCIFLHFTLLVFRFLIHASKFSSSVFSFIVFLFLSHFMNFVPFFALIFIYIYIYIFFLHYVNAVFHAKPKTVF